MYLKNLIELGIVEREFSVDAKTKEHANTSRGTYRLTDNFFRFWYAFGFANYSQLEDGDADGVYKYVIKPALHEYASFAFEDVCREFVSQKQKRNELPRVDLMRRLSKRLTKIERHFMTLKQLLGLCDRNRNFIQGKFPEAGNGNGAY